MAVRKDQVQINVSFITDESKAYAKLIESNKGFIKDLNTAKAKGEDVTATIRKMAAAAQGVKDTDLTQLVPAQLISRARQLQQVLQFIPESAPEYAVLNGELKRINDRLATIRASSRGVAEGLSQSGSRIQGFFTNVGTILAGLTFDRVLQGITQLGVKLFQLAPQLEILDQKVETIFGDALPKIDAAAKKNAQALGQTTNEYRKSAAAIGDLLIPMQFQREEAADLSLQLVDLSGALAEWEGGQYSATEVSKILSKAILGEREELKSLGIAISEEDVKNRVREKGLDKLSGVYLQQARAIATVELIMEKSTDAQDAFAKGSESLTRRQAELGARFKSIAETLAVLLLPALERLANVAETFVTGLENISEGLVGVVDPAKAANDAFSEQRLKVNELEKELPGLLKRYDELTGNSTLTKDEQAELAKVIAKIGEITPTAITEIDNYGVALGINAVKSREFLEAEQARLKFLNKEAIQETKELAKQLAGKQAILKTDIERGKAFKTLQDATKFGAPLETKLVTLSADEIIKKRNELRRVTEELTGAEAQLKFLQGKPVADVAPPPKPAEDPNERLKNGPLDPDEVAKANKKANKELKDSLDLQLKAVETAIAREQVVVEQNRLDNKLSESEYQKQLLQLQEEEYTKQLEVYRKFGQTQTLEALELRKKLLQVQQDLQPNARIDVAPLGNRNSDNQVQSQTGAENRAQENLDTEFSIREQRLRDAFRNALILEEEYQLQSLELERNKIDRKLALLAEATGKELETVRDLEEKKAEIQDQILDKQAEAAERRRKAEINGISAVGEATRDLVGTAAELLAQDQENRKKNASAIKAFQKAEIIIAGILEVQRIWANAAEYGPLAPVIGGIQTGIAVARSAFALSKVDKQKFARGGTRRFGIFGGKPHSSGGTKGVFDDGTQIEVERDEMFAVVNKRSTGMLQALSRLNEAGGGIPFMRSGGLFHLRTGGLAAINTTPNRLANAGQGGVDIAPLMQQVDRMIMALQTPKNIKANIVYSEYEATRDEVTGIQSAASI